MSQIYTRPFFSPIHERVGSACDKRSLEDQYTSGDFLQSGILSSYLDRHYIGGGWKIAPPLSQMAEAKGRGIHDEPGKIIEDSQPRPDSSSQHPPREQLPPLSSLFGSSTHQNRHARSPYSDHQSPVFSAPSSHDSRHPATPVHSDLTYDGSYFQRPSVSRQYSYNPNPEHAERSNFPLPPRPTQPGRRPKSPPYESHYGSTEGSRPQNSSTRGWSPHSEPTRPEYYPRDMSSSFRAHSESHRPNQQQTSRSEPESRSIYREAIQNTSQTTNCPPTPTSTVANDSLTTKDGLGPKIWTGTQFLPRFVRQVEVPGEGLCYFYDDGTHCKTVIDGEIVNAHWGVTKAGKPRKRLAIACITCREKKIKCDPDYPRCVQCEKFGRICKFKNA